VKLIWSSTVQLFPFRNVSHGLLDEDSKVLIRRPWCGWGLRLPCRDGTGGCVKIEVLFSFHISQIVKEILEFEDSPIMVLHCHDVVYSCL
jgi:hypothetical protein